MKWTLICLSLGLLSITAPGSRADDLYVANTESRNIKIFNSSGAGTVFAGIGLYPRYLTFDSAGNLYASFDDASTSYFIEKFNLSGAGTVFANSELNGPRGLAFDGEGNLYVANQVNNTIEKFNSSGVGTVFASSGLDAPIGLAFDKAGNLYAANMNNNTIEKFSPSGVGTVFASSGINAPVALAFDSTGNLYAANNGNNTIEKFNSLGVGTVFANSGLDRPVGLAFDSTGNLYVANNHGNTIEKYDSSGAGTVFANSGLNGPEGLAIYTAPPTIIVSPQNQTVFVGASVTYSNVATGMPTLQYQWQFDGQNIPGANSATLTLNSVATTNAGSYSVIISNPVGSTTSSAATLRIASSLPLSPTVLEPTRQEIEDTAIACATASQLESFVSGNFVPAISLDPTKMTIVLTHGWNLTQSLNVSSTRWPSNMASLLVSQGVSANIVAWDWSCAAQTSSDCNPGEAAKRTPRQGQGLGTALYSLLGPNYSQKFHFIGHSLGTLVNATAVNYLYSTGYSWTNIQMTLLDEAEIATNMDCQNFLATAVFISPSGTATYYQPLPTNCWWADNYISLAGLYHTNAVNVILTNGLPSSGLIWELPSEADIFHGYPISWYSNTIANPSVSALGFRWSFEQGGFTGAPAVGTSYIQSFNGSQWNLAPILNSKATNWLQQRFATYHTAAQESLGIHPGLKNGAVNAQTLTAGSGIWNMAVDLQTTSAAGSSLVHSSFGSNDAGTDITNTPAYVWVPIVIPPAAVFMSFDFVLNGNGGNDSLAVALTGTNVLSVILNLIQTNVALNSGPIDVSTLAGQTNEFFAGIVGGTSTNASVTVSNLQFYVALPPALQAQIANTNFALSWPLSAHNFNLQTTTNLADPNAWATITNIPSIVNLQNAVTSPIFGDMRFFRLKQ